MTSATNGEPNIVVAQIGARRHYAIPTILQRAGLLKQFYTDLCANVGLLRLARRLIPPQIRPAGLRNLLGRELQDVPRQKIACFPSFGVQRYFSMRRAATPGDRYRQYLDENQRFGDLVVARGFAGADAVYVFNGAGLEILQAAKQSGMQSIIEQTTASLAHEEGLLDEERVCWPGWEFDGASRDDWLPLAERESAERQLADIVVCGSDYVVGSIEADGESTEHCAVVPYGLPSSRRRSTARRHHDGSLRVLFAGTICLRKGIQHLMLAAQQTKANRFAFRAVGPINVSEQAQGMLRQSLDIVGPVPRSEITEQYEWADVLVLPSISEGSANVCYEAIAAGLPVITTRNAGSVVRDGTDGFIVPIRCHESIVDRLRQLNQDRDLLQWMSENARDRATEYTWERYGERLLTAIQKGMGLGVS